VVSHSIKDRVSPDSNPPGFSHLQDVLKSDHFVKAPVLSGLLLYLWQNRGKEVSEYAIALEALGRKPDFEARIDATVRVQISRLRRMLGKYYESEGSQSRVHLVIPLGTHEIQLVDVSPETKPKDEPGTGEKVDVEAGGIAPKTQIADSAGQPTTPKRFLIPAMGATIVILLFCIGLLLWSPLHFRTQNPVPATPQLPAFWKLFSDNGRSFRLVLPAPTFFSWSLPNNGAFLARDITVNEFAKFEDSNELVSVEKRLGKPSPWQNYVTLSDAFAALRLERFLDSYGLRAAISSSAESPQAIIEHENIVAFGSTSSLGKYQSDIDRMSYKLGPHEAYIIDKRLPPGSPGQFQEQHESAARLVQAGLIAFLPRGSSGSRILILQGAQTTALISWLTSEDGMREIAEAQAAHAKGPYFEAVVLCEVNGENPIQSRMVAFRPYSPNDH
jgi:hypothetical protein